MKISALICQEKHSAIGSQHSAKNIKAARRLPIADR
jgi:hypothetical protein